MAEKRFNIKNGKFSLAEIIESCGGIISNAEDGQIIIEDITSLTEATNNDISFFDNKKYLEEFKNTKARACVAKKEFEGDCPEGTIFIESNNPYFTYSKIIEKFYKNETETTEVHPRSNIELSSEVGKNTQIYPGVYIGENCVIGENCIIYPNAVIQNAIIGDNVIIHSGVTIGQDGFGYAFDSGKHNKVIHLGSVIIEDNVEIGANSTIDRGSGSDTIIKEGTKLDNMVMIAHNVKIGKHCVIASQCGIAGSTEIGDYCMFGGQCGIAGHLKIGNQVQLAAKSGVTKNLKDGSVMGGTPAVPLTDYHRQHIAVKKLINK